MKIDHEFYLMHILLSESTYFILLQDMYRFNIFQEVNGEKTINLNRFVNKILPTTISYRQEKDKIFEKTILKKYSDYLKYNDKESTTLLTLLANENFYGDDLFSYRNIKITLRISKANMKLMDYIFEDLIDFKIQKSKFIRNLLNQYSDLKPDIREFICYNKEYHLFEKAIEKKSIIKYVLDGTTEEALPILIHTCPYDSEIYLFTIKRINNNELELKTIRLCNIENITIIDKTLEINNLDELQEKINDYVFELKYFDNRVIIIKG